MRRALHGGFSILSFPGFAPGFRHGVTARGEGIVPLKPSAGLPPEEICAAAGLRGAVLHRPRQVHGAEVLEVPAVAGSARDAIRSRDPLDPNVHRHTQRATGNGADGATQPAPPCSGGKRIAREADGLMTRAAGHAVAVATADCLPVLLASPSLGVCAAVHAGWRGILAGVLEEAVRQILPRDARSSPEAQSADLEAAIGPAIGVCCFEVGEEVAARFEARFGARTSVVRPGAVRGKALVDLVAAARRILEQSGVAPGRIRASGLCTRCGPDYLESHRRDGAGAGRMIAFIGRERT